MLAVVVTSGARSDVDGIASTGVLIAVGKGIGAAFGAAPAVAVNASVDVGGAATGLPGRDTYEPHTIGATTPTVIPATNSNRCRINYISDALSFAV